MYICHAICFLGGNLFGIHLKSIYACKSLSPVNGTVFSVKYTFKYVTRVVQIDVCQQPCCTAVVTVYCPKCLGKGRYHDACSIF